MDGEIMTVTFASKWIVWALVVLTTLTASAGQIKVVSLNIEWFPGKRPRPQPEEITQQSTNTIKTLAELSPDLFIATEICDEQAFRTLLQEATPGLDLHVISNFTDVESGGNRRNQQIAIASRLPAFAGWAEPWQPTMENLRRGFSFAALENTNSGKLILVYGLHLKSNRNETPEEEQANYDIRDASVDQLLAHMAKMETQFAERGIDGWILAGDFNTNHDKQFGDHVIEKLEAAGFWNTWKNTPREQRQTWKAFGEFNPTTFDYIMLKGFGQPDASLRVIPVEVSDHNAVTMMLDLPVPAAVPEDSAPAVVAE
jgi:endonuclease/exonuclease/phosphatase family metal-dependent hydrolase